MPVIVCKDTFFPAIRIVRYCKIRGNKSFVGGLFTHGVLPVRVSWAETNNMKLTNGRSGYKVYESTASTGTFYQGIDYFHLPSLRNMSFAVNLKF